jgi:protease-4
MNSFLKGILAAFIGFLIAGLILLFIFIGAIGGLISGGVKKEKVTVKDNSVLVIKLDKEIKERETDDPFESIISGNLKTKTPGLSEMLAGLESAAKDKKIAGLWLKFEPFSCGMATLEALRNGLIEFKKSGKFIYAYGEILTEKDYFLASVADSVFLYPTGYLEWNGLNSNPIFLRGMFDKLGIEPMLFRVGKFKSAGEMFTEKQLSENNRLQTQILLNDFWGHMLDKISAARKIDRNFLDSLASNLSITHAKDAFRYKVVDGLRYEDQIITSLKKKTKTSDKDKLQTVAFEKYASTLPESKSNSKKVAVIYAIGDIVSGKGDDNSIGSEGLSKLIKQAREDEEVKAIVLRVNSPGGSALASDVIAREVTLAKKAKPVIASFGDVAASGGYYISAFCDKIYAEPTTITGSIGVFGLMFNTRRFFDEKMGITFDRVYSGNNQYADAGNPNRAMTEFEKKKMQQGVDQIYGEFIGVVQQGRNYPDSVSVDSIAQGRVWSGNRAKLLKLVDELGGLKDAIKAAAQKAGLGNDYSLVYYPESKPFFEKLMEDFSGAKKFEAIKQMLTPEQISFYRLLRTLNDPRGLYMRLLWDGKVN